MGNSNMLPKDEAKEMTRLRVQNSIILREKRQRAREVMQNMLERARTNSRRSFYEYDESFDTSIQEDFRIDLIQLPSTALSIICLFLFDEWHIITEIAPSFYNRVTEIIDSFSYTMENSFALANQSWLFFKRSYTSMSAIASAGGKGARVDRILVAEPLPSMTGKTLRLKYMHTFHVVGNKRKNTYRVEFKVDIIKKNRRRIWIHMDSTKGPSSYTRQISQCCIGDEFEIAINLCSLQGIVDAPSIQWETPDIFSTGASLRAIDTILTDAPMNVQSEEMEQYKSAIQLDLLRNWEIEHITTEWLDYQYYESMDQVIPVDQYGPFLKLVAWEMTGSDEVYWKCSYEAKYPGVIPDAFKKLGIGIEIFN